MGSLIHFIPEASGTYADEGCRRNVNCTGNDEAVTLYFYMLSQVSAEFLGREERIANPRSTVISMAETDYCMFAIRFELVALIRNCNFKQG